MQTKFKYLFICMSLLIARCGQMRNSENTPTYLDSTRMMTRSGDYQKALERFLWFHNHILERDSGMSGVRLSFALSYWKELGELYPPAMTALVEDRDQKTKQIISNGISKDLFADVAAINRELNENTKTIELFEVVSNKYPKLASEVIRYALEDLLASKRYDLIKANVPDITEQYDRIELTYLNSIKNAPNHDERLISYLDDCFTNDAFGLIQYSISIGDKVSATHIQTKALSLVNDPRIKTALFKNSK